MHERLTRREFIKYWASAGLFLVGCGISQPQQPRPIKSPLTVVPPETEKKFSGPEDEWRKKAPLARINDLEIKRSPFKEQVDIETEVISAVADFYCETVSSITRCKRTPEQLKASVTFLEREEFLQVKSEEFKAQNGRNPSDSEKERLKKITATSYGGKVLINKGGIDDSVQNANGNPEVKNALNGRDTRVTIVKSVLIHEFSHENESGEQRRISPIPIPTVKGEVVLNRISKFRFYGTTQDGSNFEVPGSDEALTEYTAFKIGTKTGVYIFTSDEYSYGGGFVNDLHQRSGVSDIEHFQIYFGEKSLDVLLRKWGRLKNSNNPDTRAAELALLMIGLCSQGSMRPEITANNLQQLTNP